MWCICFLEKHRKVAIVLLLIAIGGVYRTFRSAISWEVGCEEEAWINFITGNYCGNKATKLDNCKGYVLNASLFNGHPETSTYLLKVEELKKKYPKVFDSEIGFIAATKDELIPFKNLFESIRVKADFRCANDNDLKMLEDFKTGKLR